jgi:hypothetical protein
MLKVIFLQILSLLGLAYVFNDVHTTEVADVILWGELGVVLQIRIIAGLTFMVVLGIAASVIFKSVWVKNGYAGIDEILVDKEVGLFMSHVLAFALLEIFFFMILFYNFVQPPSFAFWICGAGFLSPEVVQAMHFIMDRFKK